MIRTDSTNVNTLIGTCNLEWRTALFTKFTRVIEVKDIFNTQLTVGLVELIVSCQGVQLQKDEVEFQIRKESQSLIESDRLFFTYSKRWWNDFLFIRPSSFSDRLVKIFATREGDNRRECVTNFIHPLKSEFIETPRHAARFVSLIPYEKTQGIGEGKQDVWRDTHTFLTVGKGDAQDHAVLLCNLLLGFHLDAYVVCGLDKKSNAHLWVLTIEIDGSVTFWDSLTGNRYKRPRKSVINNQDDKVNEKWYPYRTIGCLFNHKSFYANIQVSDSTDTCDFNLQNDKLWKQMSNDALNSIKTDFTMYPFKPTNLAESGFVSGTDLENALKSRIVQYRQDHGFKGSILFTEDLEMRSLLTQQLWKYETRKILDIIDDEYFQTGIKLLIPDGHTFKGYPANFNNHDIDGIFNSFLKSSVCREIMLTRGDHVRFCVGAKSFGYVENVGSCWIMIAVRYRKIE